MASASLPRAPDAPNFSPPPPPTSSPLPSPVFQPVAFYKTLCRGLHSPDRTDRSSGKEGRFSHVLPPRRQGQSGGARERSTGTVFFLSKTVPPPRHVCMFATRSLLADCRLTTGHQRRDYDMPILLTGKITFPLSTLAPPEKRRRKKREKEKLSVCQNFSPSRGCRQLLSSMFFFGSYFGSVVPSLVRDPSFTVHVVSTPTGTFLVVIVHVGLFLVCFSASAVPRKNVRLARLRNAFEPATKTHPCT